MGKFLFFNWFLSLNNEGLIVYFYLLSANVDPAVMKVSLSMVRLSGCYFPLQRVNAMRIKPLGVLLASVLPLLSHAADIGVARYNVSFPDGDRVSYSGAFASQFSQWATGRDWFRAGI
ncbi:Uncharacterised protein [Serratia fonticola]|uniref:Uncharacterized protein n=1 Tax=Serratia fonticola TaxID=47917 RepID=A0A4U9UMR6_SERFO|nr:Uncharacterised protein [Serratia fonticola]